MKASSNEGSTYQANGDSPLTPKNLMDIKVRMLSTNKIEDLQMWVLILLSIRLACRASETTAMRIEDFRPLLSVVTAEGNVKGLAVVIYVRFHQ